MIGCDTSTLGKAVCELITRLLRLSRLALAQAVLDDLAGLWRDPVRESHLEFHHQVAALGRALGMGQAFAPQPPHRARLDDIAARQRHHPVVERGDVDCAATESLGRHKRWKKSALEIWVLYIAHIYIYSILSGWNWVECA